jgi:putative PIN family toxin of toxin-antitoxin system
MRIVLDTNVLVSAFISAKSAPAQILALWQEGALEIVTSPAALDELYRVLTYPRIRRRLRYSNEQLQLLLQLLSEYALLLSDVPLVEGVSVDPDDDIFLALALASRAACLVSGDNHLLTLGMYKEIPIVTAATFLARFTELDDEQ